MENGFIKAQSAENPKQGVRGIRNPSHLIRFDDMHVKSGGENGT